MREVAVSVGVGSAATVAVVCDVEVYDYVVWTGCVAQVSDYFEIPPFFPFTRGQQVLYWHLTEWPAERRMGAN